MYGTGSIATSVIMTSALDCTGKRAGSCLLGQIAENTCLTAITCFDLLYQVCLVSCGVKCGALQS